MQPFEVVLTAVVALCPFFSLLVAIKVAGRNETKDTKEDGQKQGVMQSDIGYIKSSTERIEKRFDKLEEKQDQVVERLVKVEQGLSDHVKNKSVHNYSEGGLAK